MALVVDDDEPTRRLLSIALDDDGWTVLEAADAMEAMRLVESHRVDLVLLDVNLPGISGLELVPAMRNRDVAVILLTGNDEIHDRVFGLEIGASDYIVKPFHLPELLARARVHQRTRHDLWDRVRGHLQARSDALLALTGEGNDAIDVVASKVCRSALGIAGVEAAAVVLDGPQLVAVTSAGDRWHDLVAFHVVATPVAQQMRDALEVAPCEVELCGAFGDRVTAAVSWIAEPELALVVVMSPEVTDADRKLVLGATSDLSTVAALALGPPDTRHVVRRDVLDLVDHRKFSPVFQPIVDLRTETIVGFEALTRFSDGTPPAVRFAEATAAGVGCDLEAATLQAVAEEAGFLPVHAWVSVNASPTLVTGTDVLPELVERFPRPLVVELTEHDPVEDYGELRRRLDRLGPTTRLSVDDAGSGFASLRHILSLEPTFVKLDQTWIAGVENDPARQALIVALVHFGAATNTTLIAEGVETHGQLVTLRELGVNLAQGYALGEPRKACAWTNVL